MDATSSPSPSSSSASSCILDAFFLCEEQDHSWSHDGHDDEHDHEVTQTTLQDSSHFHLPTLNNQDFLWEDEELVSLFTKEKQQEVLKTHPSSFSFDKTDPSLLLARKEAVEWILKVKSHFGFTHLTAILSIDYLDRFLASFHFQKDKPWMMQLLAVTCLSLAAKVEQTQVPPLLDLQVEDTEYLFEPKNIQKMELLVMSTLNWKLNPVTPISFLDHIVRRLGLKTNLHWDFFKKCEDLILSLVSDSRFVGYQPSVLATATMLHVIDQVDFSNSVDYQNQLMDVLKTTKEKVKECRDMIMKVSHLCSNNPKKRKHEDGTMCNIQGGVVDAHFMSSVSPSSTSSSASSNRHNCQHPIKKMRSEQQKLGFALISCNAFVDAVSSPH